MEGQTQKRLELALASRLHGDEVAIYVTWTGQFSKAIKRFKYPAYVIHMMYGINRQAAFLEMK